MIDFSAAFSLACVSRILVISMSSSFFDCFEGADCRVCQL